MSEIIQRNDRHIQQDAETDLRWDPRVTITDVNVIVSQGIVTIFGEVSSLSEKLAAKHIIKHIPGVKDVINELKVKIPDVQKQSDSEIMKAITHVFLWNQQVPRDLKFTVKDSWVTLKGDVAWPFQKRAAFNAISSVLGIRGITNSIHVNPVTRSNEIKHRIESAIKQITGTDSQTIQISVKDNLVTLTGYVKSFSEIEGARHAAWSAPGVLIVENRLKFAS